MDFKYLNDTIDECLQSFERRVGAEKTFIHLLKYTLDTDQ